MSKAAAIKCLNAARDERKLPNFKSLSARLRPSRVHDAVHARTCWRRVDHFDRIGCPPPNILDPAGSGRGTDLTAIPLRAACLAFASWFGRRPDERKTM